MHHAQHLEAHTLWRTIHVVLLPPQVKESLEALRSRQLELLRQKEELQRQIAIEARAPNADWHIADFAWDTSCSRICQAPSDSAASGVNEEGHTEHT
jgi:hypothetical protein